ncbi:hypothetical protein LTR10_024265 [Elasticomyces elasticus]|uniref:N-acetyltransferase domain-containing protein n=1 Tax=Exophiala sideris TaxID=1016849 RepID=A0ABR0JCA2_9EURO|nr:hypothetical protein LTR10_024265 [Elasticomyces elasticus]KAK5031220.1 hypothetical protein LTS07_004955 [Exophiala sideris]KAK5038941.1 hypothetical protein LTR13_003972 [Exophiala sideris]KAK5060825.1 hypothetical protein LTR69_005424 [Exophiala sideris]KAK5183737.1 hypothetical protein LTR44_004019 [Eurotiomycetes sp. CCFEE 6388]
MTGLSVATSTNPSNLPARYEIRRLTEEHLPWIIAIGFHSNGFYSPIWPVTYPDSGERIIRGFPAGDYLYRHQVVSGHSFGIFDLEYKFKREKSKPHGKLYWDLNKLDATPEELLEQMDFPLISIAMSYDGINELDFGKMGPLMAILPAFGTIYGMVIEKDPRKDSWKPTRPKQVLLRNATSTRHDAEGKGLTRKLADFLMRYAAEEGFQSIQIETAHDAVCKTWSNPPAPFKSTVICDFNTQDAVEEKQVNGETVKVKVFGKANQRVTRIWVDLKPTANGQLLNGSSEPKVGAIV